MKKNEPRRFRCPTERHPNGSGAKWFYGCYFPQTDLCVGEMGVRSTGFPILDDIEWLDSEDGKVDFEL